MHEKTGHHYRTSRVYAPYFREADTLLWSERIVSTCRSVQTEEVYFRDFSRSPNHGLGTSNSSS